MVPLPTPSSLMRDDFENIRSNHYLLSEKNDGIRALLVMGIRNDDTNSTFVARISRNGFVEDMQEHIDFTPGDEVEYGSVLDGEWMEEGGKAKFIVFDCITAFGCSVKEVSLSQRLVWAQYVVDRLTYNKEKLTLCVKTFLDPKRNEEACRTLLCSEGKDGLSDGIIIAPENCGVGVGRQCDYYKYKPKEMISVDLYWHPVRKVLLCDGRDEGDVEYEHGGVFVEQAIPRIQWNSSDFFCYEEGLIECFIIKDGNADDGTANLVLKPKCRRDDKHRANSPFVVRRTCANVEEAIGPDDLVQLFFSTPSRTTTNYGVEPVHDAPGENGF